MSQSKSKLKLLIGVILTIAVLLSSVLVSRMMKAPISNATDELKMAVLANVDKYINYNLSETDKGTLVQYSLRTGIEYKEDQVYVPALHSEINIDLNQIDGKYPLDVKVITTSTEATNGNNIENEPNYAYDNTTGNLKIVSSNQNEKGEVINAEEKKDAKDEYVIICYYDT